MSVDDRLYWMRVDVGVAFDAKLRLLVGMGMVRVSERKTPATLLC